jgi:hypothetical protein
MSTYNWIITGKGKDIIKPEEEQEIHKLAYKELLLNHSKIMQSHKKLPSNAYLRVNENQEDITIYIGETNLNAQEVGSFKYSDIHKEKSIYSFNFITWVNELSEDEVSPELDIDSLQDIVCSTDVFGGKTVAQVRPFMERFRRYVLLDYRPGEIDKATEDQNSITTNILITANHIMNHIAPDTTYEVFLDKLEAEIS